MWALLAHHSPSSKTEMPETAQELSVLALSALALSALALAA